MVKKRAKTGEIESLYLPLSVFAILGKTENAEDVETGRDMAKALFRKASIERLSSPDQLDELLVVVKPNGWIALCSICLLILGIGIWSFVGSIPITAQGKGILLEPTGLQTVTNRTAGLLVKILVSTGDDVKEGQLIAILDNPILSIKLTSAQHNLVGIREALKHLEDEYAVEKEIKQNELKSKIDLETSLLEEQKKKISELTENMQKAPETQKSSLEQQITENRIRLEEYQKELQLLQSQILLSETSTKIQEMRWELQKAQTEADLLSEEKNGLFITAPKDGRVIQLDVDLGKQIPAGTSIMWMEAAEDQNKPLPFYAFIPTSMGEKIKEGMEAQINLLSVNQQLYGYLLGTVSEVLPYAASESAQQLAGISSKELKEYLQMGPSSMLVLITLTPDPSTPSGYKWTTKKGPSQRLGIGSKGDVRIIIEKKSPISYVLPPVKTMRKQ